MRSVKGESAMMNSKTLLACVLFAAIGCATTQPVETPNPASNEPAPVRENPYLKLIDQSLYTPFVSEQTGPLPESAPLKVAQWGILDGYEVVGYAELQGDTIQDRIKLAEKYARAYGADVLMPKGVSTREQLKSTYRDRATQGFLIWRKKPSAASVPPITVIDTNPQAKVETPPKVNDDSLLQDLAALKVGTEPAPEYPIYGKLQRLTYNRLIENPADIKTQNYRGASYALKMFKIPDDIGLDIDKSQNMAMLATKSGENKLFLLVPSEKTAWLQDMIKSDKVMEYVYKPVGLYKDNYPVIQFVDEMK
jgi:hypothetical protein